MKRIQALTANPSLFIAILPLPVNSSALHNDWTHVRQVLFKVNALPLDTRHTLLTDMFILPKLQC